MDLAMDASTGKKSAKSAKPSSRKAQFFKARGLQKELAMKAKTGDKGLLQKALKAGRKSEAEIIKALATWRKVYDSATNSGLAVVTAAQGLMSRMPQVKSIRYGRMYVHCLRNP